MREATFDIVGSSPNGLVILIVIDDKATKIVIDYIQAFNLLIKLASMLKDIFKYVPTNQY